MARQLYTLRSKFIKPQDPGVESSSLTQSTAPPSAGWGLGVAAAVQAAQSAGKRPISQALMSRYHCIRRIRQTIAESERVALSAGGYALRWRRQAKAVSVRTGIYFGG
jgi:hypothetical protein